MADEPVVNQPTEKPGETPPVSGANAQTPPASNQPAKAIDPEVLDAARREADTLRARLAVAEQNASKLAQEKADAERKRLEEEGNWKALAEKESARASALESEGAKQIAPLTEGIITAELRARLALEGCQDLDYHLLADKTKLSFAGGKVQGLEDVITDLKARKPHIFGKAPVATSSAGPSPTPAASSTEIPTVDVTKMSKEEYHDYRRKTIRGLRAGRRA